MTLGLHGAKHTAAVEKGAQRLAVAVGRMFGENGVVHYCDPVADRNCYLVGVLVPVRDVVIRLEVDEQGLVYIGQHKKAKVVA